MTNETKLLLDIEALIKAKQPLHQGAVSSNVSKACLVLAISDSFVQCELSPESLDIARDILQRPLLTHQSKISHKTYMSAIEHLTSNVAGDGYKDLNNNIIKRYEDVKAVLEVAEHVIYVSGNTPAGQ